jgi:hypothetical protein
MADVVGGSGWDDGQLLLFGALAFAVLEIIQGIGKGIANDAQQITEEAGASVQGVFNAIANGTQAVGVAIGQDFRDFENELGIGSPQINQTAVGNASQAGASVANMGGAGQ